MDLDLGDKSIDIFLLDVRKLTTEQRGAVLDAVKAQGVAGKTYLIQ